MAVDRRLRARNLPGRASGAAFTVVGTAWQATGHWSGKSREQFVNGDRANAPTLPKLPGRYTAVPPHTTNGHSAAVPSVSPAYVIVPPALPRPLPSAGWRLAGLAEGTTQPIIGVATIASTLRPKPRVGGGAARVTTSPKPRLQWRKQGR